MKLRICAALAVLGALVVPGQAMASPVATSEDEYRALGAVFPDPHAGCEAAPCSPHARGAVPATQFIQFGEFERALRFMNQRDDWKRYMEVWPLDDGNFPGNNLGRLEFDKSDKFRTAGLPTTTLDRVKSDIYVVRVTNENVPDAGKKRYTLSLSIHGIERAGVEGGTRAMEDLVTAAATTGRLDTRILPAGVKRDAAGNDVAPTFGDVLDKTIIYFLYPNPDGWRRGSFTDAMTGGGVFFQRYNGNGIDPNRDWPDIGFTFRGYSGGSEPETQALMAFHRDVERKTGAQFDAGDDLHGMGGADAFSYTLLPHGRHDLEKDARLREAAKTIHRAQYEAEKWSPLIVPPDAEPAPTCSPAVSVLQACTGLYAQTWGTVYDTIDYTTTGTLGDWFDSSVGLGADGIDNEMAFSHIDKNIVFDPHTEQLHVDGNKSLIYGHIAELLVPTVQGAKLDAAGRKGYVENTRVQEEARELQAAPEGTEPQLPIVRGPTPQTGTATIYDIDVEESQSVFNGGMRVDVTSANAQGVGDGSVNLEIQCQGCDAHYGVPRTTDWMTVSEDFNQSSLYLQSGVTAAVNYPPPSVRNGEATGVKWRARITGPHGATKLHVEFTSGPASSDGGTAFLDKPPAQAAYDVANTDFFRDLRPYARTKKEAIDGIDPRRVIAGLENLRKLDTLVLADDPLPGYTGSYGRPRTPSLRDPIAIDSDATVPGAYNLEGATVGDSVPVTYTERKFQVGSDEAFDRVRVRIDWESEANDFDMYLYRETAAGLVEVARSTGTMLETNWEELEVVDPMPGTYVLRVHNFAAVDPRWRGMITFVPLQGGGTGGDTGAYTVAERDRWLAALRIFVEKGGNLVLTDGALRALPGLTSLPEGAVSRQKVYAGQVAFSTGEGDTLSDPLAAGVKQPGGRFGSGFRRQLYEPTPLGFAIQNPQAVSNSDESHSRQYDVDRELWEGEGIDGRTAATSVNSGTRDAAAVHHRTALGELSLGKGRIRIVGALLPQPTEEYDHPLGLEPYAVTWTGYQLIRNLLDWEAPHPGKS